MRQLLDDAAQLRLGGAHVSAVCFIFLTHFTVALLSDYVHIGIYIYVLNDVQHDSNHGIQIKVIFEMYSLGCITLRQYSLRPHSGADNMHFWGELCKL